MSETVEAHRRRAAGRGPVAIGLVTVSDTRTVDTDVNGRYLRERIEAAGHVVSDHRIVRDEPTEVLEALAAMTGEGGARLVLFNGGTGISRRDTTFDALEGCLDKTLPGFGELFRMLSWEQVGAAAMLSRAVAGIHGESVVISTPGSPAAVRLAWEKLIEPEIEHLVWELGR
jgi:molybdopterin adenylyltransferase